MIVSNDKNTFPYSEPRNVEFPYKGNGRIYVEKPEQVAEVEAMLKEKDTYEFEEYYPKGFVAVYEPPFMSSVYLGKYEPGNLVWLLNACWEKGIRCFVYIENSYYED